MERVKGVSSNHHMIVKMSTAVENRFFEACRAGDVERIRRLIADGVNPKKIVADVSNVTPLHVACRYHHL